VERIGQYGNQVKPGANRSKKLMAKKRGLDRNPTRIIQYPSPLEGTLILLRANPIPIPRIPTEQRISEKYNSLFVNQK
jgi:hypothetical protein